MLGQGMGVIVSQWVTGSPRPSSSGRWWDSLRLVSGSWQAGFKGCVSGQNDLKLLVSYNLLPRFLGPCLVCVGLSSMVCCGSIIGVIRLMEVSVALIVPRNLLNSALGTINHFFLPLHLLASDRITMASASSIAPTGTPPSSPSPSPLQYRRRLGGTEHSCYELAMPLCAQQFLQPPAWCTTTETALQPPVTAVAAALETSLESPSPSSAALGLEVGG